MEDLRSISSGGRKSAREGDISDWFDPIESAEVKRLREDLLQGFFYDSDPEPVAQDLDLLIRSFQEEISNAPVPHAVEVVDLTLESGELGDSDADLGLPPRLWPDIIDDVWTREAELAGVSCGSYGDEGYEYVAFDGGLFEYSDVGFDQSDEFWDLHWRSGHLPTQ